MSTSKKSSVRFMSEPWLSDIILLIGLAYAIINSGLYLFLGYFANIEKVLTTTTAENERISIDWIWPAGSRRNPCRTTLLRSRRGQSSISMPACNPPRRWAEISMTSSCWTRITWVWACGRTEYSPDHEALLRRFSLLDAASDYDYRWILPVSWRKR